MKYTIQLPGGPVPAMEHGAALIAAKACIDIWGRRGKIVQIRTIQKKRRRRTHEKSLRWAEVLPLEGGPSAFG